MCEDCVPYSGDVEVEHIRQVERQARHQSVVGEVAANVAHQGSIQGSRQNYAFPNNPKCPPLTSLLILEGPLKNLGKILARLLGKNLVKKFGKSLVRISSKSC